MHKPNFLNVVKTSLEDSEYFKYSEILSNSKLKMLNPAEGGSYDIFLKPFSGEEKSFYQLGSAIHALILEPDKYIIKDFDLPSKSVIEIFNLVYELTHREKNKLTFDDALEHAIQILNYYNGSPGETRLNNLIESGKLYYDYLCDVKKDGELLLTKAQKQTLFLCVESIKNNQLAKSLLINEDDIFRIESYVEDSFEADLQYKTETFKFKGKLDFWSIDYDTKTVNLIDIKTTASNVDQFMGQMVWIPSVSEDNFIPDLIQQFKLGSFQNYRYYRQLYIYKELLRNYLKDIVDETWTFNTYIIVVQTTYNSRCVVYKIEDNWLKVGEKEFNYLIDYLYKSKHNECCNDIENDLLNFLDNL